MSAQPQATHIAKDWTAVEPIERGGYLERFAVRSASKPGARHTVKRNVRSGETHCDGEWCRLRPADRPCWHRRAVVQFCKRESARIHFELMPLGTLDAEERTFRMYYGQELEAADAAARERYGILTDVLIERLNAAA